LGLQIIVKKLKSLDLKIKIAKKTEIISQKKNNQCTKVFFYIEERASNHSSGHLVQVLIEHASFFVK